jgi:hypothetical protein
VPVLGAACGRDGGTLISPSADRTVHLWNTKPLR